MNFKIHKQKRIINDNLAYILTLIIYQMKSKNNKKAKSTETLMTLNNQYKKAVNKNQAILKIPNPIK